VAEKFTFTYDDDVNICGREVTCDGDVSICGREVHV